MIDKIKTEIFYKLEDETYIWAWREAKNVNVWKIVKTFDEIEKDASRMFPDAEIILTQVSTIRI